MTTEEHQEHQRCLDYFSSLPEKVKGQNLPAVIINQKIDDLLRWDAKGDREALMIKRWAYMDLERQHYEARLREFEQSWRKEQEPQP